MFNIITMWKEAIEKKGSEAASKLSKGFIRWFFHCGSTTGLFFIHLACQSHSWLVGTGNQNSSQIFFPWVLSISYISLVFKELRIQDKSP